MTRPGRPRIAYLPGDGIGPEVLGVARRVLVAAGFRGEFVEAPVGWSQWERHGEALPEATLELCRSADATLFGAITSKSSKEADAALAPRLRGRGLAYRSPILRLRKELDLFANVRPVASFQGNPANLHQGVDLVIFRENTEGLYAGLEAHPFPAALRQAWKKADPAAPLPPAGAATAITARVITRAATHRIVRAAFMHAQASRRGRVTLVEKPNVLRATGGLVRDVFLEVARDFPKIAADEENVDAACAHLVRRPQDYEVLVATNLFGDILSDVAAEVAGGLPLAASGNLGPRTALFEPVHGSAPGLAGKGLANPLGAVLAAAMMARHLQQGPVADRLEQAVRAYVASGRDLPRDLGGDATIPRVEEALTQALAVPARA